MKIQIDGIHWIINEYDAVQPICPKHHLELEARGGEEWYTNTLICDDGHEIELPRIIGNEKAYVLKKLRSKEYKSMKLLNLDDEAIPIAERKIKSDDNKFFVTGVLTKSKVGLRLVIYAGEVGSSEKTQIFVEPEIKRLAFDQANLHPTDVFTKVEAIFKDGGSASLDK